MNTNDIAADDSWSSLAQELGLGDEPVAAPAPSAAEAITPHLSELPDAEDGEDTALEPGLAAEPSAEGDESGEGDDGKRRRRRRRRRRKGGPAEGGDANGDASAESGDADEDGPDESANEGETPADIAMRDVVANWNVPSWDELIAGLYRPGH
jgi:hypothetical protein